MFWILIFFGLLPSFVWLIFFLQEDKARPEPVRALALVFLFGALSTAPIYFLQKLYNIVLISSPEQFFSPSSLVFLAFTEEIGKFLVVYFLIRRSKAFDEPVDAMIYMIIAALGFATVENVLSIFTSYNSQDFFYVEVSLLRLIGATLIHVFSSGLIGFYWGKALSNKAKPGFPIFKGMILAVALHAIFNFYIIKSIPLSMPLFILIVAALFVFRDFELLKSRD